MARPRPVTPLIATVVLPFALVACAVEADDDDIVDDPGFEAAAVCLAPTTTPTLSESLWSLVNHENRTKNVSNYGTAQCTVYTVGARNVEWFAVTGTALPSDEEECEDTDLVIRKYRKGVDSYVYVGSRVAHGEINEFGVCDLSITYDEHDPNNILRYSIMASKTTCSGMYCYTTYGRPLNITARGYDP